jgi:hypothetical protein
MINVRLSSAPAEILWARAAKIPPKRKSTRRNSLRRPWAAAASLAAGRVAIDMEISRIGEYREDMRIYSGSA